MSLDLNKLKSVRVAGEKTIAQCPACAKEGSDRTGEHLVIFPDGKFGCVAFSGESGKEHRRRIFELAGDGKRRREPLPRPRPVPIRPPG